MYPCSIEIVKFCYITDSLKDTCKAPFTAESIFSNIVMEICIKVLILYSNKADIIFVFADFFFLDQAHTAYKEAVKQKQIISLLNSFIQN